MSKSLTSLIIILFSLVSTQYSYSQSNGLDVTHYILRLEPDIPNSAVKGEVEILFKLPAKQDSVIFSCGSLEINNVNGKFVSGYEKKGKSLIIKLKSIRNLESSVTINYQGIPKRGMIFNQESSEVYTVYSTNEWMICNDVFGDRATIDMNILVPQGLNCIASGEFQDTTLIADKVLYKWKQSYETPFYTYGLAIGSFHEAKAKIGNKTLQYYSPSLDSSQLSKLYLETPKMLSFFEEKTGIEYPQSTYSQILMGTYYQEMSGFAVFNEKYAESVFRDSSEIHLTGHELAHQWWGNMITCKNLKHFWLNEAFAVYMATAFHEVHFGLEKYESDIAIYKSIYDGLVKRGLDRSLIFEEWKPTRDNRGIAYYKGAYVLHLLRNELGDKLFWNGIKEYSQQFYGKFVETQDFQKVMEEVSGNELGAFFNEWVYN